MKKNKFGFTLAEVLVSMTIVGVIMAISVQTIKVVRASYSSTTYFEFINIQKMAGELIAGMSYEPLRSAQGGSIGNPTTEKTSGNGISYTTITDDSSTFCKFIIALSNTAGSDNSVDCSNLFDVTLGGDEPKLVIEDTGEGSDWDNPTFIASSARRYYLSNKVPEGTSVSNKYGYYLIAVDLNGTQGPNTTEYDGKKIPDIVTFMILDNGEVFPLSFAADNLKVGDRTTLYLNSKVKGYYFKHDDTRTTSPRECGKDTNKRCNFGVIYAPNTNTPGPDGKDNFFFSYREAYCSSLGTRESAYESYCAGLPYYSLCPPSDDEKQFDVCRVENIKPAFKYNF